MIKTGLLSLAAVFALAVAVGAMYFASGTPDSAEASRWSPRVSSDCKLVVPISVSTLDGYRWFDRSSECDPR